MRTAGIKVGDLVLCDRKGRIFHAEVTQLPQPQGWTAQREFGIRPLNHRISYTSVKPTEITGHWAKRKG